MQHTGLIQVAVRGAISFEDRWTIKAVALDALRAAINIEHAISLAWAATPREVRTRAQASCEIVFESCGMDLHPLQPLTLNYRKEVASADSLEDLLRLLQTAQVDRLSGPAVLDICNDPLPDFGGVSLMEHEEILSWDPSRVLVIDPAACSGYAIHSRAAWLQTVPA